MADIYRDFVFTRNTVAVAPADTAIQVEDVTLFPSNSMLAKGEYYIGFESGLTYPHTFEIVRLTKIDAVTKTLTVVRAQAGTTALGHSIVTYIKGTLTSDMVRRARAGVAGTALPAPDSDLFLVGDRGYLTSEYRYYIFSGNAAFLKDTFTRAASALTMGTTEQQTVTLPVQLPGLGQYVIPYVGVWVPVTGTFGINANGQAYLVSGTLGSVQQVNLGGPNFDASLDAFASTTASSDYGIVYRTDPEGKNGYYLQFFGTTATLYRISNSVYTTLALTTTYTTNAVHTWRITTNGNAHTIYRDGTSVISFTETLPAFIAASPPWGNNFGFRYGNAASTTDTAIYWDNFTSTQFGNTALNTPLPQGWIPASDASVAAGGPTAFLAAQVANLESNLLSTAAHLDDVVAADVALESTVLKHGLDLTAIGSTFDDLLPVIQQNSLLIPALETAVTAVATQVDEVLDTFVASLATTVQANTRLVTGDAQALAGEYILANTASYAGGVRNLTATYESFGFNENATPSTINLNVLSNSLILSFRGTWTYYSSTSLLDGVNQTEQARFDGSSAQARIFTSVANIAPGSRQLTFTGGGGAGIYFAYGVVIPNGSLTGAGFVGTTANSAAITSALNHLIVVFCQSNNGTINTPTATGLTFTQLRNQPSGNQNQGALFYAYNTTGSTSVTINCSAQSGFMGFVAGSIGGGGSTTAYTAVNLPAPAANKNSTIRVQNIDPTYPVNVLGTIAGVTNGTYPIVAQYGTGTFTSDGTNWYVAGSGGGSTVSNRTANYTAKNGDVVLVNATSGAVTITLPAPTTGFMVTVKKVDASANTVTASSTANIDGVGTFVIRNQYESFTFTADGTTWWVT